MSDALQQALEATRANYEAERLWSTFLLDAYTGGGGFQGSVRQPDAGWWGAAATRYAPSNALYSRDDASLPDTYLDRFPREDAPKFKGRIAVSHYWNFVGPLTDLKLSYMLRKAFAYDGQPDELAAWRDDVDGQGTTWDELRPLVALMAALWGWTPLLVDMDPAPEGMSKAQADALELGKPRAIPLTPANLRDWSHDGKGFTWVKVRTDHVEQEAWDTKATQVARYAIWTPTTVDVYEVRQADGQPDDVRFVRSGTHPFGQVPIAIFRHSRCPGDDVRGLPMHAGPAVASKRLFNLLSERDEHIRQQVFAVLVVAREDGGDITLGTDNALGLAPDAAQKHYYLSPDPGIATTYKEAIEAEIKDGIYRPARVEFSRPTAAAVSGTARAYEFAQTNRAIADFAGEFARGEEWMDEIAWAGMGGDPSKLDNYSVGAPRDFDIEDMASEVKNTLDAISADLGATMESRLKIRLAQHLDPDMPADVVAQVEAELEEAAAQAQADRAMAREMLNQPPGPTADPDADPNADPNEPPAPPPPG